MAGTAAAAAGVLTVIRTSSEPARARSRTWAAVAATSAVSVLVMDWTTMGAPVPIDISLLPWRTRVVNRWPRALGPEPCSDNMVILRPGGKKQSGSGCNRAEPLSSLPYPRNQMALRAGKFPSRRSFLPGKSVVGFGKYMEAT